jgi:hypothetical protein
MSASSRRPESRPASGMSSALIVGTISCALCSPSPLPALSMARYHRSAWTRLTGPPNPSRYQQAAANKEPLSLAEALDWGRESVAFFRRAGDHIYAANTLFIMAQRSMYAGIGDDEVHEWLAESQALAEAAGSEDDQAHATVGFGQLAWLRGDHAGAAQLLEECLPALRWLGDQRCAGRALHMLGERAREQQQLAHAEELLRASVAAIAMAGQSIVLVSTLESLAAVFSAQGRPQHAALLLGTAHTARKSASAYMRPAQPPDHEFHRSLAQVLGTAALHAAHSKGKLLSPVQALHLASSGHRRNFRPAAT